MPFFAAKICGHRPISCDHLLRCRRWERCRLVIPSATIFNLSGRIQQSCVAECKYLTKDPRARAAFRKDDHGLDMDAVPRSIVRRAVQRGLRPVLTPPLLCGLRRSPLSGFPVRAVE